MIASHTMVVPHDPQAISLSRAELNDYLGAYQVDSTFTARISREGDDLILGSNGGSPSVLKVEVKDVVFVPDAPGARRILQRDSFGHIAGYINRRDGNDILLKKAS